MLCRLFSVFDPCTRGEDLYNWIFFPSFLLFFFYFKFIKPNKISVVFFKIKTFVISDLVSNIPKISHIILYFFSLFLILILRNYLGLLSYIFSRTRHVCIISCFSYIFWLRVFFVNLIFNFKYFLSHLAPEGISYALLPLIVLIETLRNLIRPLTLIIRISANITAGHLLIILVSRFFVKIDLDLGTLLFLGNIGLRLLERIVIFVQAYVFVILLSLYFAE